MKASFLTLLLLAILSSSSPLVSRGFQKCKTLQASSNNGGRKIAIVIDESDSMETNDPWDLRIDAGRAINDWLISSGEAGGGKKADLVSIIGFDDATRLLYPLGNPSGADKVFTQISERGGTFIAGGVDEAISELTKPGHDPTANNSAIVVLTDGNDSSASKLVESIDTAGQQGIRVSFGFLTGHGTSYQDPNVLSAILGTGGMYATIDGATAQNAFVNLVIVHGLTDNDNPSPRNSTTLYNGLSIAFVLDDSGTNTLTYTAEARERLVFSIASVAAGALDMTANDANGKELGQATVSGYTSLPKELQVTAASSGALQLKIVGEPDQRDAVFIVGVNSSIPLQNCTLGEVRSSGLSNGAKAGIGISIPIFLGLLGTGAFFLWKYWKVLPPKSGMGPPPNAPNQPPMDYKQPFVQTTDVPTPSPQPTNTHPGWAVLPTIPPKAINPPPSDFHSSPQQPSDPNQSHPLNYDQPGQSQQPFNQLDSSQTDPSHPNQIDQNVPQEFPSQADPFHPTNADPSQPTQPDSSHPSQTDPSHPNQADPSHPNQADPSYPNQADPPHSNQADPSHPTQADPSHHTQADPSHPTQTDPSHPTQADPSHSPQPDPTNPNHPPEADPNQPGQNPNDPQDPHPKRVPMPRFRFFGRRRRKNKENQDQNQVPGNQYQITGSTAVGSTTASPPQQYMPGLVTYPQTAYAVSSGAVQPQKHQNHQYDQSIVASPQPQYIAPARMAAQTQQYTHPMGGPKQPIYSQGQSTTPLSAIPPPQPYTMPMRSQTSSSQPQYQYSASFNTSHLQQAQPQYPTPARSLSLPQQYPTRADISLPPSLVASAPPQLYASPNNISPPQQYIAPVMIPQHQQYQHSLLQQFPRPPSSPNTEQGYQPSQGFQQFQQEQERNRHSYNVSPILPHAEPVRPAPSGGEQENVVSPMNMGVRMIPRKAIGGQ